MRAGKLATIRLNPKDCMTVVDILDKLGVQTTNLSFSQAVKLATASAFESLRISGIVPVRDGFDYLNLMAPFDNQTDYHARGLQLKMANTTSQPTFNAPALVDESPERKKRRIRYDELMFKYKSAPDSFPQEDLVELAELIPEFQ